MQKAKPVCMIEGCVHDTSRNHVNLKYLNLTFQTPQSPLTWVTLRGEREGLFILFVKIMEFFLGILLERGTITRQLKIHPD
jgi:hypothetical protein